MRGREMKGFKEMLVGGEGGKGGREVYDTV